MTLKLNHPCKYCKKELILGEGISYQPNKLPCHTDCIIKNVQKTYFRLGELKARREIFKMVVNNYEKIDEYFDDITMYRGIKIKSVIKKFLIDDTQAINPSVRICKKGINRLSSHTLKSLNPSPEKIKR